MNFVRPTDIQYKTITHVLDGEDVMAIAQTGTGKTAAFGIPLVELISRKKNDQLQAVVLVPTRELAKQISEVLIDLGKNVGVKTFGLYGGVEQEDQIRRLNKKLHILVSTPGRLFDLTAQGHINLKHVRHLVLDEADLMLAKGFNKDIQDVCRKIPRKRQTLFFTATIDKQIKKLAYDVVRNAIRIQISPKNPVAKNIDHSVAFMDMDHKRFFLENIIQNYPDEQILVFVRTQVRAERVVKAMERAKLSASYLHGGLNQDERFKLLDAYRKGEEKILVTTDVAARGIDIPSVKYVVNYDLPDNPENYVHRCGRCGRGKNKGFAISFCADKEEELLQAIEEYTGEEITHYDISRDEYDSILFEHEEGEDNWQKLIDQDNKLNKTTDRW